MQELSHIIYILFYFFYLEKLKVDILVCGNFAPIVVLKMHHLHQIAFFKLGLNYLKKHHLRLFISIFNGSNHLKMHSFGKIVFVYAISYLKAHYMCNLLSVSV